MFAPEAQLTAGEVLRAFHHDEPFLFLGAAFNTVTIILIGLCIIRRKADGMLLSLACFAHLYGIRLWINSDLLRLSIPASEFFHRFSAAVDYLVPVSGIYLFLFRWVSRQAGDMYPIFVVLFLSLSAGSMLFGTPCGIPRHQQHGDRCGPDRGRVAMVSTDGTRSRFARDRRWTILLCASRHFRQRLQAFAH